MVNAASTESMAWRAPASVPNVIVAIDTPVAAEAVVAAVSPAFPGVVPATVMALVEVNVTAERAEPAVTPVAAAVTVVNATSILRPSAAVKVRPVAPDGSESVATTPVLFVMALIAAMANTLEAGPPVVVVIFAVAKPLMLIEPVNAAATTVVPANVVAPAVAVTPVIDEEALIAAALEMPLVPAVPVVEIVSSAAVAARIAVALMIKSGAPNAPAAPVPVTLACEVTPKLLVRALEILTEI